MEQYLWTWNRCQVSGNRHSNTYVFISFNTNFLLQYHTHTNKFGDLGEKYYSYYSYTY